MLIKFDLWYPGAETLLTVHENLYRSREYDHWKVWLQLMIPGSGHFDFESLIVIPIYDYFSSFGTFCPYKIQIS